MVVNVRCALTNRSPVESPFSEIQMAHATSPRIPGNSVVERLLLSSFSLRRALIVLANASLLILVYYAAFLLRFDYPLDAPERYQFFSTVLGVLVIKLPVFYYFGLLRGWWRYVGMSDLLDLVSATTVSASLLYMIIQLGARPTGYPRSVIIIDLSLTILIVGGARFAVRAYSETVNRASALKSMLIIGAGGAGTAIIQELRRNPQLDYNPIGFVDDDPTKIGIKIHGRKVLGTTNDITRLISQYGVESVLIAIPSASGKQIEQIIHQCRESKVEFKILTSLKERINGSYVSEMRTIRVDDLLGREPVRLNLDSIRAKIGDKTLLITGAGGSIGSELARQVARFRPRRLLLFERSENDLFRISNELARLFPDQEFVPVVGDILDVSTLRECFALYRPDSVFHAAAYKHVPMMELNCFQAVSNNIFGTYNVALVANQYAVKDFVLISSDKAVNPTNIMGATKRVSELIILGLQNRDTRFCSVRFGNVLGSNGSVLPTFEQQLRNGGPLTITHPEMKRFFMTIPEAVQLVLQASTMGRGGEIFVLDMGEPVRILDLAKNLIRISGHDSKEIKIVFTGLRPGEKLFEELQFEAEGLKATSHHKIRVLDGGKVEFVEVRKWLDELTPIVEARNVNALVAQLRTIVPEYLPSPEILGRCDVDRFDRSLSYRSARAGLSEPKYAA